MLHSRKVSEWPCGSSNHPVTGTFYNAAPATIPQRNHDTPRQKWNSWPLCGTPRAHLYLAGSDFELLVNHWPLIPLLNSKTVDEMPSPRLTRLKEKLTLYRFTAVWRPGVEHKVVVCFSRHPVDDPSLDDSQEDDEAAAYVRAMLLGAHADGATCDHILPLLDPHLTWLRTEANSDDKYKCLRTMVQQGVPTNKRQLDAATAPFSDRTCGSLTTWLCSALGSSSQRHFGVKSCTAYTVPTRANSAPYAALGKSSTGQESRRTFRT